MGKQMKAKNEKEVWEPEEEDFIVPRVMPVLPTGDLVPFPTLVMALVLSDENAIKSLEEGIANNNFIFLCAGDALPEEGEKRVGVVSSVMRVAALEDGQMRVLFQGIARAEIQHIKQPTKKSKVINVELSSLGFPEIKISEKNLDKQLTEIREGLGMLTEYGNVPEELSLMVMENEDPIIISYMMFAHLRVGKERAQKALEENDGNKLFKSAIEVLQTTLDGCLAMREIQERAKNALQNEQNQYFLREQLKQLQQALGGGDGQGKVDDLDNLKAALAKVEMPDYAKSEVDKQLSRLERMYPESSEYAMLRTYLEWFADLPWKVTTEDKLDVELAKKILDKDHFGLEHAKDRILEYLSVRKLKPDSKGPILCFVGPPGVGKTSLGRSIAKALGRNFLRMSLGGMRDEAEIRGHRRTYIGALPGRIIQGLKEAKSNNPVFVLDELDKVGADYRGDPAAALLEILDPEQNKQFRDLYLNVPFDLSDVMFVATANTVDTIPSALLDRLEVIYISGYTIEEKYNIAKKYLVPRQIEEQGLENQNIKFSKEGLHFLIEHYTRESGVRNLNREIASLCRKIAREIVEGHYEPKEIGSEEVMKYLGVTKYDTSYSSKSDAVGIANGLAWTAQGGEVMPIEAQTAKGHGELILTGHLGTVMQESAKTAMFYARANAKTYGIDEDFYQHTDIHIHVPNGAIPKDGPSAGVTLVTALVSALSNRKVSKKLAMTGEITLRGQVLAVGGIKEKALAAIQLGIKKIIIPAENAKDLEEIPEDQRKRVEFILVKEIGEVLKEALI